MESTEEKSEILCHSEVEESPRSEEMLPSTEVAFDSESCTPSTSLDLTDGHKGSGKGWYGIEETKGIVDLSIKGNSEEVMESENVEQQRWDFREIQFPNMAEEESTEIVMQAPNPNLLPSGVQCSQSQYTYHQYRPKHKTDSAPSDKALEFSVDVLEDKKSASQAKSWKEWKECKAGGSSGESSLAKILWEGDVKPLLQPQDASTTGNTEAVYVSHWK